jgi:phosphoglycolate phosphatase-like HAD superfamily hydrolase
VSVAGRTDAWIFGEVARRHHLAADPPVWERLRLAYFDNLQREILLPGPAKGILPGVRGLLETLAARRVSVALLTGNTAVGARIKLEHFDLWRYFPWGVFGDAAHDRNTLLPSALERVQTLGYPRVTPEQAVVVGDTPFDVAVAVAGGSRSVAVATGSHDRDALAATGATVVLTDLADLDQVLRALGVDHDGACGRDGLHSSAR